MLGFLSIVFEILLSYVLFFSLYIFTMLLQCTRHGSGTQRPFGMASVLKKLPFQSGKTDNKQENKQINAIISDSDKSYASSLAPLLPLPHRAVIKSGSWGRR